MNATNVQLRIAEQGQITDRYNAAIANLGSRSIDVRLGGIYALQRLMKDSPRDQPTVIAVLCAFVRDRAVSSTKPPNFRQPTDIQAALTVVGTGNTAKDSRATVVDFDHAQLATAQLSWMHLSSADFSGARLSRAYLGGANLSRADLSGADLSGADLHDVNLSRAHLSLAYLSHADLTHADLAHADLARANLKGANLSRADVTHADFVGAKWSKNRPAPDGWVRDPHSGRLISAGA